MASVASVASRTDNRPVKIRDCPGAFGTVGSYVGVVQQFKVQIRIRKITELLGKRKH